MELSFEAVVLPNRFRAAFAVRCLPLWLNAWLWFEAGLLFEAERAAFIGRLTPRCALVGNVDRGKAYGVRASE